MTLTYMKLVKKKGLVFLTCFYFGDFFDSPLFAFQTLLQELLNQKSSHLTVVRNFYQPYV